MQKVVLKLNNSNKSNRAAESFQQYNQQYCCKSVSINEQYIISIVQSIDLQAVHKLFTNDDLHA